MGTAETIRGNLVDRILSYQFSFIQLYSPKFFRSRSGNGFLPMYFIKYTLNHIVHLLTGNECSVAKTIQSCSMKTVYKIITRKWIRLMLFSKFWYLLWQSARQPRHSMYFHGLCPSEALS